MFAEQVGDLKERDSRIAIKIQSESSSENVPTASQVEYTTVMSFSFEISRLRTVAGAVAKFCSLSAIFGSSFSNEGLNCHEAWTLI